MKTLAHYLLSPQALAELSDTQWDILLRQAQSARLHGSIAHIAPAKEYSEVVTRQLQSARVVSQANQRAVQWELCELKKTLAPLGIPLIALKGAAYVLRDLPCARGRFLTDVDILVPRARLAQVEDALKFAGFSNAQHHPYDQKYYRQWMHELPPMQHMKRGSSLDVHHHILPLTARAHPPIELMLASAVPAADGWLTLCPEDMTLHSITHLFFDGEWDHALRDLWDIHQLLQHFARENVFWHKLLERAKVLQLLEPLMWALAVIQQWFNTSMPEDVAHEVQQFNASQMRRFMHKTFIAGSTPDHASCRRRSHIWARRLLFLRGHYLRMPLTLLIPHLIRKSVRLEKDARAEV